LLAIATTHPIAAISDQKAPIVIQRRLCTRAPA
jgi:hypothetical protein